MFNGYKKAITFSYDDGVTQDKRLIEIFDKYGLKCTFNLNSNLFGNSDTIIKDGILVSHKKIKVSEVSDIYKKHEIAVHTLTHPFLPKCDDKEIIRQVEEDRINLSEIILYLGSFL